MTNWLHLMLMSQKSLWLRRIAKSAGPCPTAICPGAKPDISPTRSNLDLAGMTCRTLQLTIITLHQPSGGHLGNRSFLY